MSFVASGGLLYRRDLQTCDHIEALRHHFRRLHPDHEPSDHAVDVTLATTSRRVSRVSEGDDNTDHGYLIDTNVDECPLALILFETPTSSSFGICCITTSSASCLTCGGHYCHHLDRTLKIAGRYMVSLVAPAVACQRMRLYPSASRGEPVATACRSPCMGCVMCSC